MAVEQQILPRIFLIPSYYRRLDNSYFSYRCSNFSVFYGGLNGGWDKTKRLYIRNRKFHTFLFKSGLDRRYIGFPCHLRCLTGLKPFGQITRERIEAFCFQQIRKVLIRKQGSNRFFNE